MLLIIQFITAFKKSRWIIWRESRKEVLLLYYLVKYFYLTLNPGRFADFPGFFLLSIT